MLLNQIFQKWNALEIDQNSWKSITCFQPQGKHQSNPDERVMLSVPYRMFFSSPIIDSCNQLSMRINCQSCNQLSGLQSEFSAFLSGLLIVHNRICVSYIESPAWESPAKGLYLIFSTIDMPKNRLLGQVSELTELEQLSDWSDRQAAAQSSSVYCTKQIAYPLPLGCSITLQKIAINWLV